MARDMRRIMPFGWAKSLFLSCLQVRLKRRVGVTLRNRERSVSHFFVNASVRGQYDRPAYHVGITVEVRDDPARFANQKRSGRSVPGVQSKFPETVKTPAGHAGQVQRSGAVAAYSVRAQREIVIVVNIGACEPFVHRKSGAKQARR